MLELLVAAAGEDPSNPGGINRHRSPRRMSNSPGSDDPIPRRRRHGRPSRPRGVEGGRCRMSALKLTRLLKLGSRGKDVRAVKRGLARAGHGTLAMSFNPLLGPLTVRNLKNYQRSVHLMPDGVYGPDTHGQLIQWFDAFARKLYKDWEPVG